ncbi:hypothetical protein G6N82_07780 [Altererythrobacter sp. BO-6]|uniref:hypothetical protein n=1 Tax=Altererythrobacter sp. BO-6 TaxID=2604537 RepID=UPI0013E16AC9|nr:hypothetical protein [Altererythrobacter sp. BO-6]QIG54065.1 hypothetical protein G6N82_07780 [Altererythrobacter sp. BO-6]
MRKLTLTLAAAAFALGGATIAHADHHGGGKRGPNPDTDGDGVVSLAEHNAQTAKMFARMDANGDGVINEADREARRAERFAKMDTDGNGELSEAELKAAREARAAKKGERKGKIADRSGERRGGDMARPGGKRGPGMMMLRAADTDGDKSVTRAEFDAAAAKRFAAMDTDGSGGISAEERQAAHEKMRARMQERRGAKQPG